MAQILPDDQNTLNAQLVATPETIAQTTPASQGGASTSYNPYNPQTSQPASRTTSDTLSTKAADIPKVAYTLGKKVLSLDVETTGLNPWEYAFIVCSVWDLDEPKSKMVTFSGWDEEKLCIEMFDYIAKKEPDVILAFNAKFESRCFVTRAMLYHIKAPWIWRVEWHDMMAMLEGGWKNGLSGTMPAGSEENWLKYFFNESKPYTIPECFEGVRNHDLTPMIIRNRTCVQGQGDMYQLFMYCQSSDEDNIPEEKASATRIDEKAKEGLLEVKCKVCDAINEVTDKENPGSCWRCAGNLPVPSSKDIVKEVVREIKWEYVGLTAAEIKKLEAAKSSSK